MHIHGEDPVWLSEAAFCSLEDLAELSGLSAAELTMLVESGVLQPAREEPAGARLFHASCIVQVRAARRLRDDFELDAAGLTVAVNLLGRIRALELELQELSARHP